MSPPTPSLICSALAEKVSIAVRFAAAHSVYPQSVSVEELTTAQVFLVSFLHSLLCGDVSTLYGLLSVADRLPQLRSSFLRVWLRDDYNFRKQDVGRALSTLAHLVQQNGLAVPQEVLEALSGLEEKYDLFDLFYRAKDTTSMQMLACLNPLVSRQTQAGPGVLEGNVVAAKPTMVTVSTQASLDVPPSPTKHVTPRPMSDPARYEAEMRLLAAAEIGDVAVANQALKAGAVPDCRDMQGLTPLHVAVRGGHQRVVRLLLAAGAIVDCRHSGSGTTPLHTAARFGRRDCALILLDCGANPDLKDWTGKTPLQVAVAQRQKEVVEVIRANGGR